ncbi:MAG TPA: cyclic dehypoxanthinyl futalosine synthase [Candidatus Omnitrophota bacterium]|nr:cyclic dehypoxanthinyl futalosine synthase [Candidatus Omnitrophota bacterium]
MTDVFQKILQKRLDGGRLSPEEGLQLYACDLISLGKAAQRLTPRLIPNGVTFVVDRNISYTNICTVGCDFCAFHRRSGHPDAFVLTLEQILKKVEELVALGGTQILIQGGIHPDLPLDYYLGMVRAIHEKYPQVHIHSFSAVEMDELSKKSKMPLPELFKLFKEAGLNSLPGGGAEILAERVRKKISPRKISSDRWLKIMRTAHEAGLKTTATMVFGHIETLEERVLHLVRLRDLQDQTRGFRSFIPWSFVPYGTPKMDHINSAGGDDYLRTVAISRLMLDNFQHIQSGWLTEGQRMGQIALAFGCDDMGGTLIEDKVLEPTGIKADTRREDLIRLIRDAGFIPVQRNTNYEIVKVFEEAGSACHG